MLLGCKCGSVSVGPAINKRSGEFYRDLKLISVGDTYSCKDIMKSINRTKVTFQQAAGEDGKQTIEQGDRARTARGACTPCFRARASFQNIYTATLGTNNLARTYIILSPSKTLYSRLKSKDLSWRLKEHSVVATLISSGIPFHIIAILLKK